MTGPAEGWFAFLPHGWSTLAVAVGLAVFVRGYVAFGPLASLVARTEGRLKLPEATLTYTPESLHDFVTAVTSEAYRRQLKWDIGFALLLGAGLTVVLDGTLGWALASGALPALAFVPAAGFMADVAEDVLLLWATRSRRAEVDCPSRPIVVVARVATWVKFLAAVVALALVAVGTVALAFAPPGTWSARNAVPLVMTSIVLVVAHWLYSLRMKGEMLSVALRAAAAFAVVLWGADWLLSSILHLDMGETPGALGFDRSDGAVGRALLWGGIPAVGIIVACIVASYVSAARAKLPDPRFANLSWPGVGLKVLGILVGTVFLEEILFRGLLLVAWSWEIRFAVAVAASSVTFGLWHIGPALQDIARREEARQARSAMGPAEPGPPVEDRRTSGVMMTVVATAAAGIVLCLFRSWSQGIWAPMLIHWAVNSGGVVFSKRAASRRAAHLPEPLVGQPPSEPPGRHRPGGAAGR